MIEKANVATKILLAGSVLWVGTMVFKSDERLKSALKEIGAAKADIKEAKNFVDLATQKVEIVKGELSKLNINAQLTGKELESFRKEREKMKTNFDDMIKKNSEIIKPTMARYEDTKQRRINLLQQIAAMNLDKETDNNIATNKKTNNPNY